jgi:carbonic anhydrase
VLLQEELKKVIKVLSFLIIEFQSSQVATCKSGLSQSPLNFVDIGTAITDSIIKVAYDKLKGKLQWDDRSKSFSIIIPPNERANYAVTFSPIDAINKGLKKKYILHEINFRVPSEHTFWAHNFDLEIQFVHQIPNQISRYNYNRLIFSLFASKTSGDDEPSKLLSNVVLDADVEMQGLLESVDSSGYIYYPGSLTYHPCTEDVNWVLYLKPLKIDSGIYQALAASSKKQTGKAGNNREVQLIRARKHFKFGSEEIPLRVVEESS